MGGNVNKESPLENSILRDIPKDKLDDIARGVQNLVVPANGMVFKEGDPGDYFYIISSGKVRVFKKYERGVERDLSVLGPGDSFGEMALLSGEPRTANVQALEETRLMVLSKEHFDSILREYPNVSTTFIKEMRRYLLREEELIEQGAEEEFKASQLSWLDFLLVVGVSILLALSFNHSNPNGIPLFPTPPDRSSIPVESVQTAMEEMQKGEALIVDAMPSNFFQKRHIKGAVNMPLPLFDIIYMMTFANEDKQKKIVVYGSSISRMYDLEIAGKLILRGYKNVSVMDGGVSEWEAKGYPVEEKAGK